MKVIVGGQGRLLEALGSAETVEDAIGFDEPSGGEHRVSAVMGVLTSRRTLSTQVRAPGVEVLSIAVRACHCGHFARTTLARLLGYSQHLAELTGGRAREVIWLSHYAPVEPMSPSAA